MTTRSFIQRLETSLFLVVAVLLLSPSAAFADPEIELDEWIGEIDPNEAPGTVTLPPAPPNPGEGYPTGGPGAPTRLVRVAPNAYWDGISEPSGQDRPNPREISQGVVRQEALVPSPNDLSDMVWQWGQFLDHDIGITEPAGVEPFDIRVPYLDPFFDPFGVCLPNLEPPELPFNCLIRTTRSGFDPTTGTDPGNPRQQLNDLTALIDADNVYGHDAERTLELRTLDGTGRLKVTSTPDGDFLPFNENGFPNAPDPSSWFFLAGDIRVNETVPLSAMHTLWVREHNYIADSIRDAYPTMPGDLVFAHARRMVITEMQIITFNEFLPAWLGNKAFPKYSGFDPNADPGMVSAVSTAFYRLGHTMLSPAILRLDANGNEQYPALPLMDAFFQCEPGPVCRLITEGGLEPLMKGLSEQVMQRIDNMIVDDVRNFLFGPPGAGGLDLASLNIQRGRDHGLPDYNTYRVWYGLTPVTGFGQITDDPVVVDRLFTTYGNVNLIDPWVGALSEKPLGQNQGVDNNILVGELLFTALTDQFLRIRNGDPNWYQNILSTSEQRAAEKQTLAKVIARNTTLSRRDLNANVFIVK